MAVAIAPKEICRASLREHPFIDNGEGLCSVCLASRKCQFEAPVAGETYRCTREAAPGFQLCWHHMRREDLP